MDTDRTPRVVPFGYEPPEGRRKGALVVYDAFDSEENGAFLDTAAAAADRLRFATLVLYPIHDETLRRMTKGVRFERYAFRLDRLHDWKRKRGPTSDFDIAVDNWEGKRKNIRRSTRPSAILPSNTVRRISCSSRPRRRTCSRRTIRSGIG